ncbi:hypothetical protein GCM10007938_37950 [Vibrio zhanjiangensis]|uniref:Uncharacterized protein n=1 Tax=Vibrio zhanjiangensis TaxID=1046128 RepID=A0ABQ6F422_9VIBR|nr:hypothetical protein GCM10007938_37950 [Vibrio zhanjiangensis]
MKDYFSENIGWPTHTEYRAENNPRTTTGTIIVLPIFIFSYVVLTPISNSINNKNGWGDKN